MSNNIRDIDQQFWQSPQVPHLTIRRTLNSTQGYKAHSHTELSIGIIESGSTCLTLKGKQQILNEGETILIAPEEVHACNSIGGKARSYYMLYVDNKWCCDILSKQFNQAVDNFYIEQDIILKSEISSELGGLLSTLMDLPQKDTISEINALLFSLLSQFCSPSESDTAEDQLAQTIKDRLLADITEPPTIQDIAEEVSRPAESLIRIFKRRFGITPKSFLNNHRIEKAKLLLKNGMDIVDVANEVGFSDQSQLHKAFVNYTASTPGQYQSASVNF